MNPSRIPRPPGTGLALCLALLVALCAPVDAGDYETDCEAEARGAFSALLAADFDEAAKAYGTLFHGSLETPLAEYYYLRLARCASLGGEAAKAELARARKAVLGGKASPVLLARLRWTDFNKALAKGAVDPARSLARSLGVVTDWAYLGPFENEGETGFATVYGPEKDVAARTGFVALDRSHDGKAGKVSWSAPKVTPLGALALNHVFRESDDVCGYALTHVYADREFQGAFRIGTDGAVKIWLNGGLVFAGDTYRSPSLDQDVIGVELAPGWNEILVKTCHKKGSWRLLFRITEASGRPWKGMRCAVAPWMKEGAKALLAPRAPKPDAVQADDGARGYLASRIATGDATPLTAARWAFLALATSCRDENDRTARNRMKAAVEKQDHPILRLLWAATIPDRNKALSHVRTVCKTHGDKALPWFELAKLYGPPRPIVSFLWIFTLGGEGAAATQEEYAKIREVEIWEKEEAYLRRVLSLQPAFYPARLALAYLYCRRAGLNVRRARDADLGAPWAAEAVKRLTALREARPDDRAVGRLLDAFHPRTPAARVELLQSYLAKDFTDSRARNELVGLLRQAGRFEEALKEYGNMVVLDPLDRGPFLGMARLFESRDDQEAAVHCLEMALGICPDNVDTLQKLAELHLLLGRRDKAVALLKEALAIRPQLSEVARRLRHLGPREKEFWTDRRLDLAPVIAAARKTKAKGTEDAVCLLKNDVLLVNDNGTSKLFTQRVLKILTEKGANENRWMSAYPTNLEYWPSARGDIKTARVVRPDGSEVEGQWYEGSTNASFENLRKGDVIVFEAKVEEVGEPRYKGYFGLMLLFQDKTIPFVDSRITFIHSRRKKLHFRGVKCPPPAKAETVGDLTYHSWRMENLPLVKEEFNMPSIYELCPYVHASTFATWNEISEWVAGICRDQFESCDILEKRVKKAVAGLSTDEEKVDALFKLLVSEIRYEHLSLADHAYRPFKACRTWTRKYGDCKDTAALIIAMLKIAGIEARFVLVRAGQGDQLDLELPSMHIFNHAIAFVPSIGPRGLFLDCTARYCGSRELPSMDQGAIALVVAPGKEAKALYLPWDEPGKNLNRLACQVALAADGSATVDAKAFIRGDDAGYYRMAYQKGSKRKLLLEREYNRYFRSAKASRIKFGDLADYNRPVEYTARLAVPALARKEGGNLRLRGSLFPLEVCSSFLRTDERYHDLLLGHPRRWERTADITLPEGWSFHAVPASWKKDAKLAAFSIAYEKLGPRTLRVKAVLTLRAPRIGKDDYPALRAFGVALDKAESEEIVVGPAK